MAKKMRLDRFLANAKLGTRKEVKKLIKKEMVKVNDEVVKSPHTHIDVEKDKVVVDGKEIKLIENLYYMFNKPSGYLTAKEDKFFPTIMEFFEGNPYIDKLFPIGRLDIDTEGLLIITTDGQLAHRLTHPKWNVEKEYVAVVDGIFNLEQDRLKKFEKEGVYLKKSKYQTKPFKLEVLDINKEEGTSTLGITITEGKYHIVKRILREIGFPVINLKRVRIGSLKLDENLSLGEYRELTPEEIKALKELVKL